MASPSAATITLLAFSSFAPNFVPGDTNGTADAFLREFKAANRYRPLASKKSGSENAPRTRRASRWRARLRARRLRLGRGGLARQAPVDCHHDRARADRHAAVEALARGLVLARQRARRRSPGARADAARRDRSDESAARRADGSGALGRLDERRAAGHAAARDRDPRRARDGRPHLRVPVRRRRALDADAARPGRLHADPVPDRAEGALPPRRLARQRLLERGHRARAIRSAAATTPTCCRRSRSTNRWPATASRAR